MQVLFNCFRITEPDSAVKHYVNAFGCTLEMSCVRKRLADASPTTKNWKTLSAMRGRRDRFVGAGKSTAPMSLANEEVTRKSLSDTSHQDFVERTMRRSRWEHRFYGFARFQVFRTWPVPALVANSFRVVVALGSKANLYWSLPSNS